MPRGINLDLRISGTKGRPLKTTEDRTRQVAFRMTHAQPAFKEVAEILERGEKKLFEQLRGRYVLTGATRDSLTEPTSSDAIREIHGHELIFGTKVYYAKYLRRGKKSAVLVLKPTERKLAGHVILDYIIHGVHGATKGAVR